MGLSRVRPYACSKSREEEEGKLIGVRWDICWGATAGAHLMGSDLYNKLSEYLKTHLIRLRTVRLSLFPPKQP